LGGVILQAPYRSIMAVVKDVTKIITYNGAWKTWKSEQRIQHVTAPVLLVHGKLDKST
jgi:hypothetical protein